MVHRICKAFEVESGHMLSKHPGACRHPHGHSRRIEVVLASDALDDHDMVCDFKAVKLALRDFVDRFDHAMAINSADPLLPTIRETTKRIVLFEGMDPTTEAMAKMIFDHLASEIARRAAYTDEHGATFAFPEGLRLERVRVSETPTSWAEYGIS
ncbi:MAG: 6-carboxytetrahydropterin synthase [Phycisphaerales bacterium]|nr:MAG: 6-carboxytetrahydropterin synthase [Phycisphaerales bacterium]